MKVPSPRTLSALFLTPLLVFSALHPANAASKEEALIEARRSKLQTTVLPDLDLRQVALIEAIVNIRTAALYAGRDAGPENIVLKMDPREITEKKVTLVMKAPTMESALAEVARQVSCKIVVQPHTVSLVPEEK